MKQEKPFTGFSGRFRGPLGKGKITYYKGFPEQSTPVFNFCLFINERQGIRLRYYKRSCWIASDSDPDERRSWDPPSL